MTDKKDLTGKVSVSGCGVMNNSMVAHLWANKSRPQAKGSSFYFDGDTIYSYGSHFPIARHYKGVVLFTTKTRSVTTAKHKSIAARACSHIPVFYVDNVMDNPSGKDIQNYRNSINSVFATASRQRN